MTLILLWFDITFEDIQLLIAVISLCIAGINLLAKLVELKLISVNRKRKKKR